MLQKLKNIDKRTWLIISAVLIVLIAIIIVLSTFYVKHKNAVVKETKAKKVLATELETTTKPTTTEPTTEARKDIITVKLKCSSFQNDLNIKFIDKKSNQYIKNIPFTVSVKDKSGKEKTYTDKDVDGKIYLTKIKASDYTVKLKPMKEYVFTPYSAKVTVKDKPEYKVVKDIKKEVKKDPGGREDANAKHHVKHEADIKDTVNDNSKSEVVVPKEKYLPISNAEIDISNVGSATDTDKLCDKKGRELFYKKDENYLLALAKNYDKNVTYFYKYVTKEYKGWQSINGKRYYFDKNGNYVTGQQAINGIIYRFNSDGSLQVSSGIDVSRHQGYINWKKVKEFGIQFAIIRCGYRGSTQGGLHTDSQFINNIRGATANGIDVGVYFFSQAINQEEANEEASLCVKLVNGYHLKYPIFIDTESSGGRADNISRETRTAVCKSFCKTIRGAGYQAGVYANKYWLGNKLYTSQLADYRIWVAQWNNKPTYTGKYQIWQYSDHGKVDGINGYVDLNWLH